MNQGKLFIFDMDGVITNTLPALYQAYCQFLGVYGYKGTEEEFQELNGPKLTEIIETLKKKYLLDETPEELTAQYTQLTDTIYKTVKLSPGLRESLVALKNTGAPLVLASSAKNQQIQEVLNQHELHDFFDLTLSGDQVKQAKPHPEIYNLVKEKYPNYDSYVFEDSENGVNAALSAGMHVFHYTPPSPLHSPTPLSSQVNQQILRPFSSFYEIDSLLKEIDSQCFTLSETEKIKIHITPSPFTPTSKIEAQVQKIWEQRSGNQFNGQLLFCKTIQMEQDTLVLNAFVCEYKYFYAQFTNPDIKLNLFPLGVSGILLDPKHYTLIAQRDRVTEYPDAYELVPSGSLDGTHQEGDSYNLNQQVFDELEEETPLKREDIQHITPFCLIFDKNHQVYDIGCQLFLSHPLEEGTLQTNNTENKHLQSLSLKDLENHPLKQQLIPTSQNLLRALNKELPSNERVLSE